MSAGSSPASACRSIWSPAVRVRGLCCPAQPPPPPILGRSRSPPYVAPPHGARGIPSHPAIPPVRSPARSKQRAERPRPRPGTRTTESAVAPCSTKAGTPVAWRGSPGRSRRFIMHVAIRVVPPPAGLCGSCALVAAIDRATCTRDPGRQLCTLR
jgi:hypothetical protein